MKKALITGITGQDGSYISELLIEKGYSVYGLIRRSSNINTQRIEHILDKIKLVFGDLTDSTSLNNVIRTVQPDEIYNLASQSFVGESWNQPALTGNVTGLGVTNLLEAIRQSGNGKEKIYQASSSEMFGKVRESPQNETTPFYPRSPYGVAKLYAHWMCINYRESYGIYISNGILFNHESERRGIEFVTKKITDGVAKIVTGKSDHILLGNLEAKRDWGYAKDYVEAMYLMLQQNKPDDFVIATGESHSVKDFVETSFDHVGLDWTKYVKQDPRYMRPAEVDYLIGDYSKAKRILGWEPKTRFNDLVKIMISYDIKKYSGNIELL
jgi:GDPmannose 4,6-dehydratase